VVIATETDQEKKYFDSNKQKIKQIPYIGKNEIAIVGNENLPPPDQKDLDII
jgi:glutaredoxin